jgi:uncharacterized protein YdaT
MPWDETYYPRSIRNLPQEVRLKAIEIANALLEEGYDEGNVIRIAIAKATANGRNSARSEPFEKFFVNSVGSPENTITCGVRLVCPLVNEHLENG